MLDNMGFAEVISLRLNVGHLVRLRCCHLEASKKNCMLAQNWSKIEILPELA